MPPKIVPTITRKFGSTKILPDRHEQLIVTPISEELILSMSSSERVKVHIYSFIPPLLYFLYPNSAGFVCPLTLFFANKDFQSAIVFLFKKNVFLVSILEEFSLFASLLVEIRSSILGFLHTSQKRDLFDSYCCNVKFWNMG